MSELVVHFEKSHNFDELVLNSKLPVIVDFYADWCGPCKKLAPILEEKAKESGKFKVVKINIDENDQLAEQFNVSSIPYVVLFVNGKKSLDFLGFNLKALDDMIASIK